MDVRDYINKNKILFFDGAMGTMLQSMGLKTGELPEVLNFSESDKIIEIHKKYIEAGSKVITTNTFGASEVRLKNSGFTVEQVIDKAVNIAKTARGGKDVFIALDIGPIGQLLEPMGTLSFERSYEIFKRQVLQGVKSGVDLILIETLTDLYEAKAAVLAAKENSNLPVFCTMSFEQGKRTFTGCNAASMTLVLQGLGVDALGVNCSLGPKEIEPILDEILEISKVPVIVQPNAGLPCMCLGETIFNISPEEFSKYGKKFAEKGVKIIGGCCGTTNEHIKYLTSLLKDISVKKLPKTHFSAVCTPTKTVFIDDIRIIGERINPTGKKLFKEALKKNDIDYVLREGISQVEAGADILDVNVGLPEINETETMVKVIKELQSILDTPLQIDSRNPNTIEMALRVYNGKAIVNSVNGEDAVINKILPLVKKYGASVVGLTLNERGIPNSAEERFKIAEKIVKRAEDFGIEKEDIFIDCLTLTAAAQQKEVVETLKALSLVREKLDVKTVLGVSNVSFGLPAREIINRTFLAAALSCGLNLPIVNPMDKEMMNTVRASKVLWNIDKASFQYIDFFNNGREKISSNKGEHKQRDLFNIVVKGIKDEAKAVTAELLNTEVPLDIVNKYIIPALDFAGEKYDRGEIFLPQLIMCAETVKMAVQVINKALMEDCNNVISSGKKIILATVKDDIHDIGKNIVKVLLENYGYEIIDLGKDVPKERIIDEAIKNNIKLIGLSALMTTTVKNMEDIIKALKKVHPNCTVMVGGAVLNKEYADSIGADYYAKDAKEAVKIARLIL
ncbi:MAG: homocysteine S-methyltransferase [Clostridiaceae bacterium]|nr:homocysteine S-methyltransferase [Clostridiaceae bacterium]